VVEKMPVDVVTDTHEFAILVVEFGAAEIQNVVVPTPPIHVNTPFDISYDVVNTGETDILQGHLKDHEGLILPGSEWEQEVPAGETLSKVCTHNGFSVSGSYSMTLEVGHKA